MNFFQKIQHKVLDLEIQLILSIHWVWHLKGHLQGVNLGQSQTKNSNFGYCKNSLYIKIWAFKNLFHLYNYEDYSWSKFQLNMTLFPGVIAPKPHKMGPIGSWTKKMLLSFLGKAENNKYPEAEIWHPESIDGWSYYRLYENFW